MRRRSSLLAVGAAFFLLAQTAQAQVYRATLSGANEIPPVNSPGSGVGIITLNPVTHEMRIVSNFSGLVAGTTAAHIHCCVVQPANAGVATTTPTFTGFPNGVTAASYDRTFDMRLASAWNPAFITANGGTPASAETAFLAGVAAGRSYLNIHSSTFPGGEIRGTLVAQTFAGNSALDARTSGAAAALDSLGAGTGATSNAIVSLAILTPAQQAEALALVAPPGSRAEFVVASGSMSAVFDQVGARLGGLRADNADGANAFWLKAYGDWARQGLHDGYAGYRSDGWGAAIGVDRQFEGLTFGGAISYADASIEYRHYLAGNTGDVASTQISVYASQPVGQLYIDGALAYAWQKFDSVRSAGATGVAAASYEGDLWGARIGAGMPIALSGLTLTPQARLDWLKLEQDAYTESGGVLALAVSSRSADRVQSSVGADLSLDADLGGVSARPFLRAYWLHDFSDEGLDTTAAFTGGGASFRTPGQALDSDAVTAGIGAIFAGGGALTAALSYDATFGDSFQGHVVQAKALWTF